MASPNRVPPRVRHDDRPLSQRGIRQPTLISAEDKAEIATTFTLVQGTREYQPTKMRLPIKPIPDMRPSHLARFWRRVEKTDTCWNWTGAKSSLGYGQLTIRTIKLLAHRVSYTLHFGPIPDEFTIDHLCRNTSCVNPAHLQAVPQAINALRGDCVTARNARKTHCPHGHPITEPEQYVLDGGGRKCLICKREREARLRHSEQWPQRRAMYWQHTKENRQREREAHGLLTKKRRTYPCHECQQTVTLPVVLAHPTAAEYKHLHVCLDCFNRIRAARNPAATMYTADMLANTRYQDILRTEGLIGRYRRPQFLKADPKRDKIVAFVAGFIAQHDRSPFLREIANGCGFSGPSAVFPHIDRLIHEGRLKRANDKQRSIMLAEKGQAA